MKAPDVADVRRAARDRWDAIIPALAPELAQAFDKIGRHVKCPHHKGATERNLRVPPKFVPDGGMICNTCGTFADGFAVLMWSRGWTFHEAVCEVAGYLHGYNAARTPEQLDREVELRRKRLVAQEKARQDEDRRTRRSLNAVWKASVPLTAIVAEPGRLYLLHRGLIRIPRTAEIRFHPELTYRDQDSGTVRGRFAALIARVRTVSGQPGSLLRLYTNAAGDKLPWEDRKKLMAHPSSTVLTGGAIHLGPVARVLGVAEGLETALAVTELFGISCWATYSATMLENFVPPPGVEKVVVFADKDVSGTGERAAKKLVERLWDMGITAGIRLPTLEIPQGSKGVDWLDVLNVSRRHGTAKNRAACAA